MKNNLNISLRKANFFDIEFLWYLRNRPDVYKYFKNPNPVSWRKHIDYIIPVILGSSLKDIFVIQKSGIPVGQVRINYETSDVSISVLKDFRVIGVATKGLGLAVEIVRGKKKVDKLKAEIEKDNISSAKLFKEVGFKFKKEKGN